MLNFLAFFFTLYSDLVLGNELNETLSDSSFSLSPDQIAQAHHKSIELDKSLGLHDSFDNFDSLSDDQSLNPTKSASTPTDEVVSVKGKELQFEI